MKSGANIIYAFRVTLFDLIKEILYFPVWWYSLGLWQVLRGSGRGIKTGSQRLGVGVMFRYWFKPMYGQTDWQGKIISFFMRSAVLFGRTIMLLIWTMVVLVGLAIYIILPVAIVYLIVK
ncbi:MAG: hypothetical protein NUV82_04580 [Candidatus Komeilibacteria bacterium]|nr:hypothetical protein [Candidatus Komeilibacteria bacterium]